MTTFSIKRRIDSALSNLGIQVRSIQEARQMAHEWHRQRRPELPEDLTTLPGYQSGERTREHWHEIEAAIQAAMKPDISALSTIINPQRTNPLPAKDIVYAPTPQPNPATPTPEVRAKLFQDVPNVAESLVLWKEDEDATERRKIVRRHDRPRNTINIPAIGAEVLLAQLMHSPTAEQSTGENERLPENFLL